MKKTKKFQPLQFINQKLRGMEAFESNNDAAPRPPLSNVQTPPRYDSRGASPAPLPPRPSTPSTDPDDIIKRSHWQRSTGYDACSDPMCGKRLGAANGQINCRHCGKLFCEEHTMYQMRLSRAAIHEPVRGLWYRVCETCFKTRDGYNDKTGLERSHFEYFKATRRKMVDEKYLETSRLETRLTRLTQLLANPPPPDQQQRSIWSSIAGDRDHIRNLEQSVVSWQDDAHVVECPFCQQPFSQYALRRHHCRTCGRVVCSDPATACSTEVGLDVDKRMSSLLWPLCPPSTNTPAASNTVSEKGPSGKVALSIRMCKDCQRTIFSKADFAREVAAQTPDQRAYQNLVQFEQGIRLMLPKFQRLLPTLQDPEKPPTPAQLAEASKVRKRLTDAFTQYNTAARRIRDLPTESPTQARLQKAIYQQASSFLHVHMLTLKAIPKILGHATPNARPQSALSSIKNSDAMNGEGSRPGSRNGSVDLVAVTALEAEEKELRERLIVLEEQKFMVSEMIADANKRRKFDEVSSLAQNVDDLGREVDQIRTRLGQMDFKGAYTGDATVK